MDSLKSPPSLFTGLLQLQSQPAVEVECVRLIKEHYRSNPQVVLEECVHQGHLHDRRHLVAAALSIAPRLLSLPGCEDLLGQLKSKWLDQITFSGSSLEMLSAYTDLCLDGDVSALWKVNVDGYKSHLSLWFDQSLTCVLPQALEFIGSHPSAIKMPSGEILAMLDSLSAVSIQKMDGLVGKMSLAEHAVAVRDWLSHQAGYQNAACCVVVATRFPNHHIWKSPDFWMMCSRNIFPPAFELLMQVLPEGEIERFNEVMNRSSASDLWGQALAGRRAREDATSLGAATTEVSVSRPSSRL